jgi:hypothetical protein
MPSRGPRFARDHIFFSDPTLKEGGSEDESYDSLVPRLDTVWGRDESVSLPSWVQRFAEFLQYVIRKRLAHAECGTRFTCIRGSLYS